MRFTFPDESPRNRRYWLLIERGDGELCYSDPGGAPDLDIVARSEPFTRWHQGLVSWQAAVRAGDITVTGRPGLARAVPGWNLHRLAVAAR